MAKRNANTTADFDRYGRWALVHPGSDDEYISPMSNPNDFLSKLTYEEAREVIDELDAVLLEMNHRD